MDATACLLEAKCGGVSVQVLTDFGASVPILSSDCVKRLGSACQVRKPYTPVRVASFSDAQLALDQEALLTLEFDTPSGRLSLANMCCLVLPGALPADMGDCLMS
uniref:AlNc14C81G5311 protein n=1 Tax=Albugo laibachii Nc14 TaxID=890382 RepID=F0WFC1_9STRA|nr:AlNc14C81G5311 [Albugo laibachii Nc14]|eukprot:CCA19903.1 AlNc14C81G5311 [Albugo laibachii Nc14]